MELGIIAAPKAESFEQAAERGLSFIEFCINVNQDVGAFTGRLESLKAAGERTGVKVGSIGRWGSDRIGKDGVLEVELAKSYRLIDAAASASSPIPPTTKTHLEACIRTR